MPDGVTHSSYRWAAAPSDAALLLASISTELDLVLARGTLSAVFFETLRASTAVFSLPCLSSPGSLDGCVVFLIVLFFLAFLGETNVPRSHRQVIL